MASVDPDDDSITRYVVQHYRYDPDRHERRHVVVAAYDSQSEFERDLETLGTELRRAGAAGELADPHDMPPARSSSRAIRARAQHGRLITRAVEHGVRPPDEGVHPQD
jgi:hypothetical protein